MTSRKFTVVTQLHDKNNKEIIEYLEMSVTAYSKAKREAFHYIKRNPEFNKSKYNTYLQNKYNILKRTAAAIINDAQSVLDAVIELKEYEKQQKATKITALDKEIDQLRVEIDNKKVRVRLGDKRINMTKYRKQKRRLVALKKKRHRFQMRLNQLEWELENGIYKVCFGTKKLLQRSYEDFVYQRDNQMTFVGSKTEKASNQLLQLQYDKKINQFHIRLRKDIGGFKSDRSAIATGRCYFNHYKRQIIDILQTASGPLTYKLLRRNGRYYLVCTFEIPIPEVITRPTHGVIGLDFNKGFITFSETNKYGHLVNHGIEHYRFKKGNATQSDLERIAVDIGKLAKELGKDIVIENLDFREKKSKTISKKGKKYNEMLHSLAYKTFTSIMESMTYRNGINLIKINPAWTSWIAKDRYCEPMKLNVHTGASYVIARKGQKLNS